MSILDDSVVSLTLPQARRADEVGVSIARPESFDCCGVRIDALSPHQAVGHMRDLALSGRGHGVHLCNAYTLSLATTDAEYKGLLNDSSLNLCDGTPVAWAGRRQGHAQLTSPVRGPGLMLDVMRDGVAWGARHVLYGSSRKTLDLLVARLEEMIPGVDVVAAVSPPFKAATLEEDLAFTNLVDCIQPHFVWVGLGTPKQDRFVHRMAGSVPTVLVAVGAAFDFAAGTKKEAPEWLHGSGLEWTYRFAQEPGRLWKRYLVGNARFLNGMRKG